MPCAAKNVRESVWQYIEIDRNGTQISGVTSDTGRLLEVALFYNIPPHFILEVSAVQVIP